MKRDKSLDSEITMKNYERELGLCKKLGGDIVRYRRLRFNVFQLEQIRLGLEHGIDVESYTNPSLSWMEMERAREIAESGVNITPYIKQGFAFSQCGEIIEGRKKGLDVSVYAKKEYMHDQMQEIRRGMEQKLDVAVYANPAFDSSQMREIRKGLEAKLDVKGYAVPELRGSVMREIRKALEGGYDILEYGKQGYGSKELHELTRGCELDNRDIKDFLEKGYKADQLEQINNACAAKVNILPYVSIELYGTQLSEIVKGLEKGLDVTIYSKGNYNWFQMREIRYGLENKIDVTPYADPAFTYQQMQVIHKCILAGVDVGEIAKVYLEPEQMEEKLALLQDAEELMGEEDIRVLEQQLGIQDEPGQEAGAGEAGEEVRESKESAGEETGEETESEGLMDLGGVIVSEDKMQAYMHILSKDDGSPYTIYELTKMLRSHGVKQGVSAEKLKEIISKSLYDQDVLVAQGKEPVDGKDGSFRYFFRRGLKGTPKVLANGTVDYKNMDLFETVKKDQLLAEYEPPTKGEYGCDVLGGILAPKKGKELPPLHGKGFTMTDDRRQYYALMDGIVELEEESMNLTVENLYVITGDVDVSTGNINFDGDVNVMGNVLAGFSVEATGNICVDGRCEGCTIKSGKDVLIRKGCQGQGTGKIEAAGAVIGQFFESAKVEAGDKMEASYLLNCQIRVGGKLKVQGRRGVIIGGYICAKQGIECYGIGTIAEVKTTLEVGIDAEDMTRYRDIVKETGKLDEEIHTLETGVVKLMAIPEKNKETTNLFNRLTKALYKQKSTKKSLEKEMERLVDVMAKQRGAKIAVNGTVYPGTKIFMNTEPYVVMEMLRNVEFVKQDSGVKVG